MTTVIRPDWVGTNKDPSGPEKYAPPEHRAPQNPGDARHIAAVRQQADEVDPANSGAENLTVLIRRVAGASMDEIDHVIGEIESIRDMLRDEGERVSREIAGYASLSHASMTAMKVIADSIKQWKDAAKERNEPPVVRR